MQSPILIVGGGLAGLFTALKLAPLPCLVLAARPLGEGASSSWAQGGVAAAISDEDSAAKHAADTVAAGAGLVDPAVALAMAEEAGDRIRDLLTYGVPFDRDLAGRLVQSREAAHSVHRVVRVKGDMAGAKIMEALVAAVRATPSITVREGVVAEDLLMQDGRVTGVLARGEMGQAREAFRIQAGETVLATGGLGALYAVTTNPGEARGQGLAMAARAGARIADTEFVQFHPTAIDIGLDPAPLATEALRGDGALLIDRDGNRFMVPIHKDAELAPRDIVARGVFASIKAGKGAFLDCRAAIGAEFAERFPTVHAACLRGGIDPVTQPIPVAPAEHYHMGGVASDMDGRSSLPGLWVAGEVGATGLHGANRLASNSLLEAVVIGARIAEALGRKAPSPLLDGRPVRIRPDQPGQLLPDEAKLVTELRRTMTAKVGVVRDGASLKEATTILQGIGARAKSSTLINMTTSALLIATAALNRRESRGGHFRSDYPTVDPALAKRTFLTLSPVPDTGAKA